MQGLDIKKPFGAAVKIWRGRLGISQEELAGRAGLHRTYVCDVERGARNVSLESIEKLARALEISIAALFSTASSPGQPGTHRLVGDGLVDILFVEDDPRDAEMALTALKGVTNWVQVVRDGETALDFLCCQGQFANRPSNRRPLLVLLDLGLPKMNGLEVLRRIKSNPRTAAIPVVVLTASDSDRDIQASKRLGAEAHIVKPLAMRQLTEVAPMLHLQLALVKAAPLLRASSCESTTS